MARGRAVPMQTARGASGQRPSPVVVPTEGQPIRKSDSLPLASVGQADDVNWRKGQRRQLFGPHPAWHAIAQQQAHVNKAWPAETRTSGCKSAKRAGKGAEAVGTPKRHGRPFLEFISCKTRVTMPNSAERANSATMTMTMNGHILDGLEEGKVQREVGQIGLNQ